MSIKGRHEDALEALARSAALAPGDAGKWIKHGQTLAELDRHEDAIVSFDKALGINPQHLAASGNRAVSLAKLGRRTESLTEMESLMGNRADVPSRFLWKGQVLEGLDDLDGAVGAYRDYVDALPRRPEGWVKLGQGLAELKRYEESIAAYEKALALNPRSKQAAAGRRKALEALGRRS